MNNLDLWESVEKTDLKFIKKVKARGGYTSISPQYQLKNATKVFGPYGKGFGLSSSEFNMSMYELDGVVINKAVFFYVKDGEKVEFPISNAIQAKNKGYIDTDFAKKLETNTVSKALSKIGFNADVYMGMFEDENYLIDLDNEQRIERAANKEEEKAKQDAALYKETNKIIEQIITAPTLSVVEGLYKAHFRRINGKDDSLVLALTKAKDKAKERFSELK